MATGKPLRVLAAGFTLLEMMVVLVIIGLTVTLASLAVPGAADSQGRELGKQLTLATRLAQTQALAGGHIIALELQRGGYRFLRYEAGSEPQWQPFTEPALLAAVTFEHDWHWHLNIDEPLPVSRTPRLYFWPDGTLSPFKLQLLDKARQAPVLWTLNGSLLTLDWHSGATEAAAQLDSAQRPSSALTPLLAQGAP